MAMYDPCMKRMSASNVYVLPSLPRAMPWISAAPTDPWKSVIDDISKPIAGGATWTVGFDGTTVMLKFWSISKPPGIGRGSAEGRPPADRRAREAEARDAAHDGGT